MIGPRRPRNQQVWRRQLWVGVENLEQNEILLSGSVWIAHGINIVVLNI